MLYFSKQELALQLLIVAHSFLKQPIYIYIYRHILVNYFRNIFIEKKSDELF